MSRFFMGLLLGILIGIGGASAFLIVYGGGDYLVSTSPRMRELEAALRSADEDRDWLKSRLREATDTTQRLESRFEALAERFERLTAAADAAPTTWPESSLSPTPRPSPDPEKHTRHGLAVEPALEEPASTGSAAATPDAIDEESQRFP